MKRYIGMMVICAFMVTMSCSLKKEANEAKHETTTITQTKSSLITEFENMYKAPMQQFVEYILEKDYIVLTIREEEKGYYVGYIAIKKNYQFEAGYEAEPPIVLEVDSYTMDEDKMVIMFKRSIARKSDEKIELLSTSIWELILTKEILYNYYKPFFEGKTLQGPLEVKAKRLKAADD